MAETTPGRLTINGMKAAVSSSAGSTASAWMVMWVMSPAVRDMMNSASPPISADMKMKTPKTSSVVCAFAAVR